MLKRVLYGGGGAAGALAAAYFLGSLTLGGAFAAQPPPPVSPTQVTTQTSPAKPPAQPVGNQTSTAAQSTTSDQETGAADKNTQDQQPGYTSSVTVPADSNANGETDEAASLQGKAKITADQAKAAGLAQFPGATIQQVGLENENGNVVYAVQLTDKSGKAQDVKVDAGTARVLNVEASGADGSESQAGSGGRRSHRSHSVPPSSSSRRQRTGLSVAWLACRAIARCCRVRSRCSTTSISSSERPTKPVPNVPLSTSATAAGMDHPMTGRSSAAAASNATSVAR